MAPVTCGRLLSRFVTFCHLLSRFIPCYLLLSPRINPRLSPAISAPPTCHLLSAVPGHLLHLLARCRRGPCQCAVAAGWQPSPRCPPRPRRRSRRWRWTGLTRRARTGEGVAGVASSGARRWGRAQGRFWDPLLQPRRGEKGLPCHRHWTPQVPGHPKEGARGAAPPAAVAHAVPGAAGLGLSPGLGVLAAHGRR